MHLVVHEARNEQKQELVAINMKYSTRNEIESKVNIETAARNKLNLIAEEVELKILAVSTLIFDDESVSQQIRSVIAQ